MGKHGEEIFPTIENGQIDDGQDSPNDRADQGRAGGGIQLAEGCLVKPHQHKDISHDGRNRHPNAPPRRRSPYSNSKANGGIPSKQSIDMGWASMRQ
ncbi:MULTISPECIES: hypothetical protein [Rhodospirillales]|uniref:hypothetical protein n=1 Tax=Rhodospirillales TaxID=204441 RepID=UPI001E4CB617|nr:MULTISPECIES: hypothetical protein [Rhodospirillales]